MQIARCILVVVVSLRCAECLTVTVIARAYSMSKFIACIGGIARLAGLGMQMVRCILVVVVRHRCAECWTVTVAVAAQRWAW